jgi:hypothetical protein
MGDTGQIGHPFRCPVHVRSTPPVEAEIRGLSNGGSLSTFMTLA